MDAEIEFLGMLIQDNDRIHQIDGITVKDHFYMPMHGEIFDAVKHLINKKQIADVINIANHLQSSECFIEIGGKTYLEKLSKTMSVATMKNRGVLLHNLWLKRQIIDVNRKYTEKLANSSFTEINDLVREQESEIFRLSQAGNNVVTHDTDTLVDNVMHDFLDSIQNNRPRGIPSGFRDVDNIIGGFKNGSLIVLGAATSAGKALKMDAKILTDSGWVLNKDLKIGDRVCSIDGKESIVNGIFPQGIRKTFKVHFIDGRTIECDGDHLWEVCGSALKNKSKVMKTIDIMEKLKFPTYKNRIHVPYFSGNYGVKKDFIVHPYILGVLLGDGCLQRGCSWTKLDMFIVDKINSLLPDKHFISHGKKHSFCITTKSRNKTNKLLIELKNIGLWGTRSYERFIPEQYFYASMEQRMELLNGILDTDGTVDDSGSVEYSSSSLQLAKDVQKLAWSLGFRCRMQTKRVFLKGIEKRLAYRMIITGTNHHLLFCTPIKKDRIKLQKRIQPLTITKVEECGYAECQCISVSHPRKLYITDDFIPTHNTSMAMNLAYNIASADKKVLFLSLEMTGEELTSRLISAHTGVNSMSFDTGKHIGGVDHQRPYTLEEYDEIRMQSIYVKELPILIEDEPDVNMSQLQSRLKFHKKKNNIDIVIIDYFQLLKGFTTEKYQTDVAKYKAIANGMKVLAKEINIPIILLSQLSRGVDSRDDHQPKLTDLKETGDLENAADIVMLLYREAYYWEQKEPTFPGQAPTRNVGEEHDTYQIRATAYGEKYQKYKEWKTKYDEIKNKAELNIAKNRKGPIGRVTLFFDKAKTKFCDIEPDGTPTPPKQQIVQQMYRADWDGRQEEELENIPF